MQSQGFFPSSKDVRYCFHCLSTLVLGGLTILALVIAMMAILIWEAIVDLTDKLRGRRRHPRSWWHDDW